jgi:hypothetical protein
MIATLALRDDASVAWPPVYVSGVARVLALIRVRLVTILGDVPGDTTAGLIRLSWTRQPRPDPETVAAAARVQVEAVPGTSNVRATAEVGATIVIRITADITTDDGTTTTATISAGLFGGTISAWYAPLGGPP